MSSAKLPNGCSATFSQPLLDALRAAARLETLDAARLVDCIAADMGWLDNDGAVRIPASLAEQLYEW